MSAMSSDWDIVERGLKPGSLLGEPGWDGLSDAQRQFIGIRTIEGTVTNGGFHAVYYNTNCAEYMPLALKGLELIGDYAAADIIRSVMRLIESDPWAGPPEVWPDPSCAEPPPGSGDIGASDEPWYALDGVERDRRMVEYIRLHPEHFASID